MKIAVTSTGTSLDDNVDPRFGRSKFFLLINTETMEFEAVENMNATLGGGSGIKSAQLMSEKGVETVLTGNCGPNAFDVFSQAGIDVIVGVNGSIGNVVKQFIAGELSSAEKPNVASHFGSGIGSGAGRGMGGGKGIRKLPD